MSGQSVRFSLGVTAVLVFCAPTSLFAEVPQKVSFAGRTVGFTVVEAKDLSPANWTGEELTLATQSVRITSETNVYRSLQANGLVPDSEAFALVYDLNPTLRDLVSLQSGVMLKLPKLASDSSAGSMQHAGYLVMLTLDPDLRASLNSSADRLRQQITAFTEIRKKSRPAAGNLNQNLDTLLQWYAEIKRSFLRRTGPPLRSIGANASSELHDLGCSRWRSGASRHRTPSRKSASLG